MKRKKLEEAMEQISDRHIAEAAAPRKKHTWRWIGAVAAILAIVIAVNFLGQPLFLQAKAIAEPPKSRASAFPNYNAYANQEDYQAAYQAYRQAQKDRNAQTALVTNSANAFFRDSSRLVLQSPDGGNRVWSPVNGYMALAMLAEVTGGNSRQQILDLLNTADTDALRTQVSALWENVYRDDGKEISVLANSLWLKNGMRYTQQAMDDLAHHYYASVYRADLGTPSADKALQDWLNQNTGNLLQSYTADLELDPQTVLALASTVYLKSQWSDDFSKNRNTDGIFHSPAGELSCTFMNKTEYQTHYYWGDSFGAVQLHLKNGCSMWFFLPDADKGVEDVLAEGQYLDTVAAAYAENGNQKYMKVNLSVPKFDVSSGGDLQAQFQALGITDVFDPAAADFTPSLGKFAEENPVWISQVQQAARVAIDEEGVVAASYIVLPAAGAGAPPDEIIDFILDRPFVFVIAKSQLPLFTGVVNQP